MHTQITICFDILLYVVEGTTLEIEQTINDMIGFGLKYV